MQSRIHKLFYTAKWNVGIIKKPVSHFLSQPKNVEVLWMKERSGNFYADPFAFLDSDKLEIYFEEYVGKQNKGIISKTIFQKNSFTIIEEIFESSIHVSYPYLLEYNGKHYCIPETHQLNEIALYEIESNQFKKVRTLIENFPGVDATVVQWDNRWWMFCTNKLNKRVDVDLHIFYANDLLGKWEPHKLNPVKSDRDSARPGGTPFIYNGKLYRPSQDSSISYGGSVVINEIVQLNENDFEEKAVAYVKPSQLNGIYKEGLHTLSSAGNYTIVDAKRYVFTFKNILKYLHKKQS